MPNARDALGLIPEDCVARFRRDVEALPGSEAGLGLAVSGGPDSMAMLLLAAAAFPGRIAAATVDHGLRANAKAEARLVAEVCTSLAVPHDTLSVTVAPVASIQAAAREARYAALMRWCKTNRMAALLTAHHADDQAETLMMRLARGAGVGGLAGIRASRDLGGVALLRPLLGWRRAELAAMVADITTVEDPSNRDPRHDRTHARALLNNTDWLDAGRLAASAAHLADAEAALDWVVDEAIRSRSVAYENGEIAADIAGLPREIARRMLGKLIANAESPVDGPTLDRALAALGKGRPASVGNLKLCPGDTIIIRKAPDRR